MTRSAGSTAIRRYVERSSDCSGPSTSWTRFQAPMATPRPEAGSCPSTHSVPRRAAASARVRAPSKRRPRCLDGVATIRRVLLCDALRDAERPRVLDEIAHLLCVERVEPRVHPVVAHIGLARQRELLRLGLDE